MNKASKRAFIAIELPEIVRHKLIEARQDFGRDLDPRTVRWVKGDAIHLTLRFLGDTPVEEIARLGEGLQASLSRFSPFKLSPGKFGCFPNPNRPRVIWIDLVGNLPMLNDLYDQVSDVVADRGWDRERRKFRPHLTMGRVKDSKAVVEAGLKWGLIVTGLSFEAQSLSIMSSELLPGGARYTVERSIKLGIGGNR